MYVLIGISESVYQNKVGGSFLTDESEDEVALFDRKEDGIKYIQDSKLKNPVHVTFGGDKIFKRKSLLWSYQDAEVRKKLDQYLPLNPTME